MDNCYLCDKDLAPDGPVVFHNTATGLCEECYVKVRSLIGGASPSVIAEVGHMTIARPDVGPGLYIIDKRTGEIISRPVGTCLKCNRKAAVLSNVHPYCEDCIEGGA